MAFSRLLSIALTLFPIIVMAQGTPPDLAESALISTFQRDSGNVLCAQKNSSLKEMRTLFEPYIKNIDLGDQASYSALAVAVYTAFPCPFSPIRTELRPSTREDLIRSWLFPDASLRLRHGPKSPAWRESPGVPAIKCEAVAFSESGEYRVAQIRGQSACPTEKDMQAMRALPKVQAWAILPNGRVKITRTDVPTQFEEWEVYAVQAPFEFFSIKFAVGDLVAYLRRHPGNEINAATTFRHFQPLK
jgi:hypothetical protein